jgi:hypothetical protein
MGHEPRESGVARSRQWLAGEPGGEPDEVDRRCGQYVLEVRLGGPEIAGAPRMQGP